MGNSSDSSGEEAGHFLANDSVCAPLNQAKHELRQRQVNMADFFVCVSLYVICVKLYCCNFIMNLFDDFCVTLLTARGIF